MTLKDLCFSLWRPKHERLGIDAAFHPVFLRYIGMEGGDYNNVLKTIVEKAGKDQTHSLLFDGDIPMQVDFALINSTKRDLTTMDLTRLSTQDIIMFEDMDVNRIFLRALEYTVNLASKNEYFTNNNVKQDFITKLILNIFTYVRPLDTAQTAEQSCKCIYFGNIPRRDIYFLILLYKMGFDVIYINPLKDEYFDVTDTDHLSEKITNPKIQPPGSLYERIRDAHVLKEQCSLISEYEQQVESTLFTGTGLYKPWQLKGYTVSPLLIRGTEIDIRNDWNTPAKVREGFSVRGRTVTISHYFICVEGTDQNLKDYKNFVLECIETPNMAYAVDYSNEAICPGPFISREDLMKAVFCRLSDGTFDVQKLREAGFFHGFSTSEDAQKLFTDSINTLVRNPEILNRQSISDRDAIGLVGIMLGINRKIVRLAENYDFTSDIPKIIWFLGYAFRVADDDSDKRECISLAILAGAGFDIAVFSPAGTSGLSRHISPEWFSSVRLEKFNDDIGLEDIKKKGFWSSLFT